MNTRQHLAAHSDSNRIVVIAGPGSGKTTVLTERIKRLIAEKTDPARICAVTFTNAAAAEIQARVEAKIGFCGTLHSLMLRLIKAMPEAVGYSGGFSILDEDSANAMIARIAKDHGWKGNKMELASLIEMGPDYKPKTDASRLIGFDFWSTCQAMDAMPLDGILHYGLRVAKAMNHTQVGFDHLLVDEYQDSSDVDHEIYETLRVPNKFFVGDPDQSLYAFRGGKPQHLLQMAEELTGKEVANGLLILLDDCHRCPSHIAYAATCLIAKNTQRFPKAVSPMRHGGQIDVTEYDTALAEAIGIAHELEGQSIEQLSQTAVLCRTNGIAQAIESVLRQWGIPTQRKVQRQNPPDWAEVRAFLALIGNPQNDGLAYRYLELTRGADYAGSAKIQSLKTGKTINSTYIGLPEVKATDFSKVIDALQLCHASAEAVEMIQAASRKLPPAATYADLLIVLGQPGGTDEDKGTGVSVTTLHGAKGKEWRTVYLPAWEEGILPNRLADIEEERRVAFVGITRASETVRISHSKTRQGTWDAQPRQQQPSRFIQEAQNK